MQVCIEAMIQMMWLNKILPRTFLPNFFENPYNIIIIKVQWGSVIAEFISGPKEWVCYAKSCSCYSYCRGLSQNHLQFPVTSDQLNSYYSLSTGVRVVQNVDLFVKKIKRKDAVQKCLKHQSFNVWFENCQLSNKKNTEKKLNRPKQPKEMLWGRL